MAIPPKVTKAVAKKREKIPVDKKNVVSEVVPQPEPKSLLSKFLFFLQLRDGFWSIPITFALYYFTGVLLAWMFGYTSGFYDPSFIQPLFLAGCVVIGGVNVSHFIVYFNFRSIQRYVYGKHKPAEGIVKNLSKEDFNSLIPWVRVVIALFVYLFFTFLVVAVYIKTK